MRPLLIAVLLLGMGLGSLPGQNISLLSLIRPRVSVFGNVGLPYALSDEVRFSEQQAGASASLPLRSRLHLKSNLLASTGSALLANVNLRYRNVETEVAPNLGPILSFAGGVTGMHISLDKGIWVYSVGVGLVEEWQGFGTGSAFGYGGFAKLKVKGLKKINAYGLALFGARRLLLPIPILGWVRVYRKRQTLT